MLILLTCFKGQLYNWQITDKIPKKESFTNHFETKWAMKTYSDNYKQKPTYLNKIIIKNLRKGQIKSPCGSHLCHMLCIPILHIYNKQSFSSFQIVFVKSNIKIFVFNALHQACQTQTTSRAANATKTEKRAAKVFKKS